MKYFKELLVGRFMYTSWTQGPIDGRTVLGDTFTELYDDPPFVHHLLELVQALIKGIKAQGRYRKPLNQAYHYNLHL